MMIAFYSMYQLLVLNCILGLLVPWTPFRQAQALFDYV